MRPGAARGGSGSARPAWLRRSGRDAEQPKSAASRFLPSHPEPAGQLRGAAMDRSRPGPWPREAAGLTELRGRPLDHDQWRRRGRGSVSSPVGPAALCALSTRQVSRMAAELAIYGSGGDRITTPRIEGRRPWGCRRSTLPSYTYRQPKFVCS